MTFQYDDEGVAFGERAHEEATANAPNDELHAGANRSDLIEDDAKVSRGDFRVESAEYARVVDRFALGVDENGR